MLEAELITIHIVVALCVMVLHDHNLRSEDEPRPLVSAIVGALWPLIAVVVVLVAVVLVVVEAFQFVANRGDR